MRLDAKDQERPGAEWEASVRSVTEFCDAVGEPIPGAVYRHLLAREEERVEKLYTSEVAVVAP